MFLTKALFSFKKMALKLILNVENLDQLMKFKVFTRCLLSA